LLHDKFEFAFKVHKFDAYTLNTGPSYCNYLPKCCRRFSDTHYTWKQCDTRWYQCNLHLSVVLYSTSLAFLQSHAGCNTMRFRSLHTPCYNLSVPVCTENIGDVFFTSAQRDHSHHSENRTSRCRNLHVWKSRPQYSVLDKFHYCWSHRYVYGPSVFPSDRLNLRRIQHYRRHKQQL